MVYVNELSDGRWALWGARIGVDGALLDPLGFEIGAPEVVGDYDVAWSGSTFVVVWRDGIGTRSAGVGSSGVFSPASVRSLTSLSFSAFEMESFAGTAILGARTTTSTLVYGTKLARLDAQGALTASGIHTMASADGGAEYFQYLTSNGGQAAVATSSDGRYWMSLMDPATGAVAPRRAFPLGTGHAALAGSDAGFMVLNSRSRQPYALVPIDGGYSTMPSRALAYTPKTNSTANLRWDGRDYFVLLGAWPQIVGLRVAHDGSLVDPAAGWLLGQAIEGPGDDRGFSVQFAPVGAGEYFVAYTSYIDSPPVFAKRVFARRVSFGGASFPGEEQARPGDPDAGPFDDGGGVVLEDAGVSMSDGGFAIPDGGVLLPDGGILLPDGGVVGPDGRPVKYRFRVGCGCAEAGALLAPSVVLVVLLGWRTRRRAVRTGG
jgi:hypothetical protein